jgi:hypothetical protein
MPTIQRDALHAFIDRQLDKVESTPIPPELMGRCGPDGLQPDEMRALWLGAGIASQIGMVLVLDPGTYVEPWPTADDGERRDGDGAEERPMADEALEPPAAA